MKKIISIALVLVFTLTLAACGNAPASSAAPAPAAPASSAAPAAESLPADDAAPAVIGEEEEADSDYIKANGKMIIGYTVYEPMNFTDAATGQFTGFDTELAVAVCAKLGVAPEFVEINWDTKEIELAAKTIDCIWNGLTITPERQESMAITVPYVKNAQVVVMKADAEYTDTSSLIGKAVCAEAGSAGESTITGDANLAQAEFISKTVQTECLMEVAAGTADACVLDLTLANAMIGEGTDYADLAIKERLAVEDYGVAFRKGSDVCELVNGIFAELKADGTMPALAEKYFLDLA